MSDVVILILLFSAGAAILVAEIFIPSHGVLSVLGLVLLGAGVFQTFTAYGRVTGVVSVATCIVLLPTFAYVGVKYWHRTPMGRVISPPNPVLSSDDVGVPIEQLESLVGKTGQALSPLRPVGVCRFNSERVSCVAEFGMIDAGVTVEGIRVSGSNLAVIERKTEDLT